MRHTRWHTIPYQKPTLVSTSNNVAFAELLLESKQSYYVIGKDHMALPVDIQQLPQGMYFLKASGEGYETSRPFTKF